MIDKNASVVVVGSGLMGTGIAHAFVSSGYKTLLVDTNERALAFYESLGFSREGELRDRVLNPDGSLESDIPMAWFTPDSSQ